MPASYYHGEGTELTWYSGEYHAGDVVIFDSRTIHATSKNYSDRFRLSLDFRW
jgi:ectoine hydroxylase-related dioxygenase (phytanoyl-CoA dioxygenase family)